MSNQGLIELPKMAGGHATCTDSTVLNREFNSFAHRMLIDASPLEIEVGVPYQSLSLVRDSMTSLLMLYLMIPHPNLVTCMYIYQQLALCHLRSWKVYTLTQIFFFGRIWLLVCVCVPFIF